MIAQAACQAYDKARMMTCAHVTESALQPAIGAPFALQAPGPDGDKVNPGVFAGCTACSCHSLPEPRRSPSASDQEAMRALKYRLARCHTHSRRGISFYPVRILGQDRESETLMPVRPLVPHPDAVARGSLALATDDLEMAVMRARTTRGGGGIIGDGGCSGFELRNGPSCGGPLCEPKKRGASLCPHNRVKSRCKDCGGGSICPHNRRKSQCKDCGGSSICPHDRRKSQCQLCRILRPPPVPRSRRMAITPDNVVEYVTPWLREAMDLYQEWAAPPSWPTHTQWLDQAFAVAEIMSHLGAKRGEAERKMRAARTLARDFGQGPALETRWEQIWRKAGWDKSPECA